MKQAACDKDLLDIENDIERIQTAIKNKLGVSNPFLADIAHHIITPHNNSTRSRLLLQSANLFKKPDEDVIEIGCTLEYLHTASVLHRHIKKPENARRHMKHVQKLWGSEASVLLGDYLLSISFQILTRLGNLDVLECVSLATQNIAMGQVLEISDPTLTASPKHWRNVTRDKIAGLFGAGAKSAAYWANASKATASTLYEFGETVGMAAQLKTELDVIDDEERFKETLKEKELWFPLCFLLHECLTKSELSEMTEKLQEDFELEKMIRELRVLFKQHNLREKLKAEAMLELIKAKECLEQLEMDSTSLQPLTSYSTI